MGEGFYDGVYSLWGQDQELLGVVERPPKDDLIGGP